MINHTHVNSETEEILDVVDEQDCVVGQAPRSHFYTKQLSGHFRAVNAFIKNGAGQLWIPRRVATKERFPLGLDASVSGGVKAGESYEQAFVRETAEEIGWDATSLSVTCLGMTTPKEGFVCFSKVYEITCDEVPPYDPQEFCEYFWLTPEQVIERIASGDATKSDLPLMVKRFFL